MLSGLLTVSHALLKWSAVRGEATDYIGQIIGSWHIVLAALGIYGFIFGYYVWALRNMPLSMLYPVYTSLSIVFVAMSGYFVFGESMGTAKAIGIGLVCAGIVVMGMDTIT